MSPLKKALLFALPASFAIGAYQGRKLFDLRARAAALANAPKAKALAYEGVFSEPFLRALKAREGIVLEVEPVRSADELIAKLEASPDKYDLATVFHWQLPRAAPRLARLDPRGPLRTALDRVSPDFRDLAARGSSRTDAAGDGVDERGASLRDFMAPFAWGAVGFAYDPARVGGEDEREGRLSSWAEAFRRPALRKKIRLLSSPIDLAFLADALSLAGVFPSDSSKGGRAAALRRGASRAPAPASEATGDEGDTEGSFGGSGDADDGIARLKKPLGLLADASIVEGGPWRSGLEGPVGDVPPVVQMSQGEAAVWMASAAGRSWRFAIPDEGGLLWTMGLALVRPSPNAIGSAHAKRLAQAEAAIGFALDPEGAEALALSMRAASPNRALEASTLDPLLKPSWLREIPLTKLRPAPPFENGGAILTMLRK